MNAHASAALVVALDFSTASAALRIARKIRGVVPWVKIGLELFSAQGPSVVHALKELGFAVFLDLKFHDIPNTVRGAVLAAASLHVDMLSLHISGGERMVRAAVEAANGLQRRPLLFGVTVLTSMAPGEFFASRGRSASSLANVAKKLALQARLWGMDGLVCSGYEVRRLQLATGLLCLTPGIRLPQAVEDDQRRIVSPSMAVRAGASYLVVGRPITAAADPVLAAENILRDMSAYPKPSLYHVRRQYEPTS